MSKYRAYTFTWNNYTDDTVEFLRSFAERETEYMIFGYETAPSTGTKHIQGYIRFRNQRSFNGICKKMKGAHIEIARGSTQDNYKYCTKEGKFEEFGQKKSQGDRVDLWTVKQKMKNGENFGDIIEECENIAQIKMVEHAAIYFMKPRKTKTKVDWFWGKTGTGKSTKAFEIAEEIGSAYWKDNTKWWNGYTGQKVVIMDDYRETPDFGFVYLLNLFYFTPIMVQTKGGYVHFNSPYIIVTAPDHPNELFDFTGENKDQLIRRIENIVEF